MPIKRVPISNFVSEIEKALNRKDGYIMGSRGQNPKKWKEDRYYIEHYQLTDSRDVFVKSIVKGH